MKIIDVIAIVLYALGIIMAIIDLLTGFMHKDYNAAKKLIRLLWMVVIIYCLKMILEKWDIIVFFM